MNRKASDLLNRMAAALDPPPEMEPDEWAEENIVLPKKEGMPGPYRMSHTPQFIPFVRAFWDPRWRRIVFVCGAQEGKSRAVQAVIGKKLDHEPAPVIYYGPTKTFVERTIEPRIVEMLNSSKSLKGKTLWGKKQKKTLKMVSGAPLILSWASSGSELAGQEAALVFIDERDRLADDIDGEGDPVEQGEARIGSYANGKIGIISTPKTGVIRKERHPETGLEHWAIADLKKVNSPIIKLWWEGSRHEMAWPCPECGDYFIPHSGLLDWDGKADGSATPGQAARTVKMICGCCGVPIAEAHKERMCDRMRPVAPGQRVEPDGTVVGPDPDTDCFSIWSNGLMSKFKSWAKLVRRWLSALASGEPGKVQGVVNTGFGELHAVSGDAPKHSAVTDCKLPYKRGQVPYGVQRVVLTVDVQKRGVYWVMRGWGARRESWLIDNSYLPGETDGAEVWDDLEGIVRAALPGNTGVNLLLIDSGYRPGKPAVVPENAVYDFCRRFSRSFARPIKGERYLTGNKWFTTTDNDVDSRGRVRKSAGLILHRLNTHEFKSRVFEKITRRKELAGGWHVPEDVDDAYAKQIVSETCRWVGGKPIWDELGANHYLDCEMMQEAAAEILKFRLLPPLPPAPDGAENDEGADVEQPAGVPLVESVQQIVAPPSAPKIRPSSWRTPNMRPRR
ncbi:terminase gpA endonuclease subunit [Azospirillum argentinense]